MAWTTTCASPPTTSPTAARGAWRDTLTSDELVAIEAESARWLVEHGYQVETEVGRRKTADLRGEDVAPRAATPPARKPSRSSRRERWGGPLLLLAAILAVLGLVTAFAAPALSVLPWVIAVAAAAVGGYLWGSRRSFTAPPPAHLTWLGASSCTSVLARPRRRISSGSCKPSSSISRSSRPSIRSRHAIAPTIIRSRA